MNNFLKGIDTLFYALTSMLVIAIICMIILAAKWQSPEDLRKDAIVNGHAEYYLDEDNERKFRWRKCDTCRPVE